MTDRELLERAAKAAGIELEWRGEKAYRWHAVDAHEMVSLPWRPLISDGDALRLIQALALDISWPWYAGIPPEGSGPIVSRGNVSVMDPDLKRAIVRAAASMEKP